MSDEINEITEGHSDYKPADTRDENVKHQLTGMYQNWFLDYASYVILERAVPHINDGLKPVQRRFLHFNENVWTTDGITKWLTLWDTPCSSTLTVMLLSEMPWYSWDRKTC